MKRTLSLGVCFILLFGVALINRGSAETIPISLKAGTCKITQDKDGFELIKMEAFTTAVGPGSHISVVWADSTPGNAEIYLKRSANWGGSWAANKRLTWTGGGSEAPAVSVDSSGSLHIVWQDNTPGSYEIYYLKF